MEKGREECKKREGRGERDGGRENGKGEISGDGEGGKREKGKGGKEEGGREGGERERKRVEMEKEKEEEGRKREGFQTDYYKTRDRCTCSKADGYYGPPVLVKLHEGLIIAQVMQHNVAALQPDPYHIYCRGLGEDQYG